MAVPSGKGLAEEHKSTFSLRRWRRMPLGRHFPKETSKPIACPSYIRSGPISSRPSPNGDRPQQSAVRNGGLLHRTAGGTSPVRVSFGAPRPASCQQAAGSSRHWEPPPSHGLPGHPAKVVKPRRHTRAFRSGSAARRRALQRADAFCRPHLP